jgi:hypothetical protein
MLTMQQTMVNKPPMKTRPKLMKKEASMVLILFETNNLLDLDLIEDHNPLTF